jgi:hypothetical protein
VLDFFGEPVIEFGAPAYMEYSSEQFSYFLHDSSLLQALDRLDYAQNCLQYFFKTGNFFN